MAKSKKSKQRQATQQAQRRANKVQRRIAEADRARASTGSSRQKEPAAWLSRDLPAVNREGAVRLFEKFDGMSGMRNGLHKLAADRNEWAGIPMPLEGLPLRIERSYPRAAQLMAIGAARAAVGPAAEEGETTAKPKIRNRFWSWKWRCDIVVWEEDGKIAWGSTGEVNQANLLLGTLNGSDAWGIEQESNAVQLLGTLLRHRQFKQYLLTGTFMEKSERSGVHYLFRRLRPTIAMSFGTGTALRALCALCLHPIGYYDGSWAGAMCPTDEVVAHLMLMRGDEHMYWRRANQHPPYRHEAGI